MPAVEPAGRERHTRPVAHRYLAPELGDRYVAAKSAEREAGESCLVRIPPTRWLSVVDSKELEEV